MHRFAPPLMGFTALTLAVPLYAGIEVLPNSYMTSFGSTPPAISIAPPSITASAGPAKRAAST